MAVTKNRTWQLRSEHINDASVRAEVATLAKETGLSNLAVQVCWLRGLKTKEAIEDFINPKLNMLTSPFKILDMAKGVDRLVQASRNNEKVRIFGDYDVDGTAGSALLKWVLEDHRINVDATQPDRFADGYGLNVGAIEDAHRDQVTVLITVDCGITSFAACERALELGIDIVVIDHHQIDPTRGLPKALAIINPQRRDCESGLKQLCGCGLAFYFSMGLRSKFRELGMFSDSFPEPNLKQHLDLVVIATAADQVPLTGDNRILVKHGLDVLKQTQKVGVRALLNSAGVKIDEISPTHLGFTLGPRINASGRMASAGLALNLLSSRDPVHAAKLSSQLESLNKDRMDLQNDIWDEVRFEIEEGLKAGLFSDAIVVGKSTWHEGVVGIVASKVTEHFHKPAIVIGFRQGIGKGSARSFGGKNILEAIRMNGELLKAFGGHHFAAGITISEESLELFRDGFNDAVRNLPRDQTQEALLLEGVAKADELSVNTLREFERLGPFGPGNPEPMFQVEAQIDSLRLLKARHLKFILQATGASKSLEGLWFNGVDRIEEGVEPISFLNRKTVQMVGTPELNRYMGQIKPSFRIKDLKVMSTLVILLFGIALNSISSVSAGDRISKPSPIPGHSVAPSPKMSGVTLSGTSETRSSLGQSQGSLVGSALPASSSSLTSPVTSSSSSSSAASNSSLISDTISNQPSTLTSESVTLSSGTPTPGSSLSTSTLLTKREAATILHKFKQDQLTALKLFSARQADAKKQLRESQAAGLKEFEIAERAERRKFFDEHSSGAERRTYIQSFLGRRKALIASQDKDRKAAAQARENEKNTFIIEQERKLNQLKVIIRDGKKPADDFFSDPITKP